MKKFKRNDLIVRVHEDGINRIFLYGGGGMQDNVHLDRDLDKHGGLCRFHIYGLGIYVYRKASIKESLNLLRELELIDSYYYMNTGLVKEDIIFLVKEYINNLRKSKLIYLNKI